MVGMSTTICSSVFFNISTYRTDLAFENEYSILKHMLTSFIQRWHLTDWNECSKTCGNGSHSRRLYCRKQFNASYYEKLDESLCDALEKPSGAEFLFQRCNEVSCPAEWTTLSWSKVKKREQITVRLIELHYFVF